jgi:hypothetical protein
MAQIFDMPEESLRQLSKLVPDQEVVAATEAALATPARKSRAIPAACVHRLVLTNDQRQGIVARLRVLLARKGFEEGGAMLPIGHVYEGLIDLFSRDSRVVA